MTPAAVIGRRIEELDTPALVVDVDALERNIERMASQVRSASMALRPHAKTHKLPLVASLQRKAGAIGVTCAKLAEAEALAAAGVDDLLISTEIAGDVKLHRLLGLARLRHVITVVDDVDCARQLSEAAAASRLELDVLVDVNVGQQRTGVEPGVAAAELAKQVSRMTGLRFAGLQGYEGHLQFVNPAAERASRVREAMAMLAESRRLIEQAGLEVATITCGGTGTYQAVLATGLATEVQPGSYVYMDARYAATDGVSFEHALFVLTSVVSRARGAHTAIVDAGLKAVTTEYGPAIPRLEAKAQYRPMGDEHGAIDFEESCGLAPGDRLSLIPSHCDTTVNLYDRCNLARKGEVIGTAPIAGRGGSQ